MSESLEWLTQIAERNTIDDDHAWGYQIRMVNEVEYCGKFLVLTNTNWGSLHFHHKKKESFIIIYGAALIKKEGCDPWCCQPGDQVTFLPNEAHAIRLSDCIQGVKKCVILEVSTHDDDDDTYRIAGGI